MSGSGLLPGWGPLSGSVMGRTSAGGPRSTTAFFSLPLYAARSFAFLAVTTTTSASIFPFVPGAQP